ncbi:MAG: prephenate dehydrogenase/arogenate dehydrogenase family protein [Chthonomonadales bacterium]|nr:prephenate dehydrogenase/arogenate dehydrogenase family protein [Chthonomonadales bacterium]
MNEAAEADPAGRSLGTVAILGLGLIGGSIARALRAGAAARLVAWDPCRDPLDAASGAGVIEPAPSAGEAAAQADLVVLAGPPASIVTMMATIAPHLRHAAVVTDVASTKARIAAEGERLLGSAFVGGHPMAGTERSGFAASRADLFRDSPWILTPGAATSERAVAAAECLARACGARPVRVALSEHDRWMAGLSHLPHVAAYGVAGCARALVPPAGWGLAAGSLRDVVRVAASDPALWSEILMENREDLLGALDALTSWINDVRSALADGDAARLREALTAARDARLDLARCRTR